jgi:alpha-tubulin suppressor-like RCC1 family protein
VKDQPLKTPRLRTANVGVHECGTVFACRPTCGDSLVQWRSARVTNLASSLTFVLFTAFHLAPAPLLAQPTLAGGDAFTLVVRGDGTLWSFGRNNNGQLGDNTLTTRRVPIQVAGLSDVAVVAAGSVHSLALTSGGALYVWGDNLYGQVGDGSTTDRRLPVLNALDNVVAIAAGEFHSVALRSNGDVYTWGRNNPGVPRDHRRAVSVSTPSFCQRS